MFMDQIWVMSMQCLVFYKNEKNHRQWGIKKFILPIQGSGEETRSFIHIKILLQLNCLLKKVKLMKFITLVIPMKYH